MTTEQMGGDGAVLPEEILPPGGNRRGRRLEGSSEELRALNPGTSAPA